MEQLHSDTTTQTVLERNGRPGLSPATGPSRFTIASLRRDFPVLEREIRPGVRLAYLDSAATTLKPLAVIEALRGYYEDYPANVHRGLHALSERATEAYESTRDRVARFLGASDSTQIVFTRGTTESINLVAQSWGRTFLKPGDEILLTPLEHHSNLVPWQMLAREIGAALTFTELTPDGRVTVESFERRLSHRTKLVAITGMSNVLGTIPPVRDIIALAHTHGARVLVDGAQSVPHQPTDVGALDADFLAFSGHKMCGPTGVGVLYAKRELLEAMPPAMGGGSMVRRVDETSAEWADVPWKFEAGTPPIAEVIGLGAAVDYLGGLDKQGLHDHERRLTEHAHRVLGAMPGVRVFGPEPEHKGGIVGFTVERVHPHDMAQIADRVGVAIRAGHHCAQPLHRCLGLPATARASFYLYNTVEEIDRLAGAIEDARKLFGGRRAL